LNNFNNNQGTLHKTQCVYYLISIKVLKQLHLLRKYGIITDIYWKMTWVKELIMKLKRQKSILISAVILIICTACSNNPATETSSQPSSTDNGTALVSDVAEEKPPLVIYHISDDEIEIHVTDENLNSVTTLIFYGAPSDGTYWPVAQFELNGNDGEIEPSFFALDDEMNMEYHINQYNGEMEYSIDGNTLKCNIKREGIFSAFKDADSWNLEHLNAESGEPIPFEGVVTDDISAIIEPVINGVLPEEFKRSEYDDEYFTPETDDFIVITYDIPVELAQPEWHCPYGGDWAFGVFGDEYAQSSVKVTYLLSFDDAKYLGTKVRLEYASIDEAMLASLEWSINLVPAERGMANEKTEDETLIANFFEERDRVFFGRQAEKTDYTGTYYGHYDQFRYFDFKALDTLPKVEKLIDFRLSDRSDAIPYVPMSSISYTAGKMQSATLVDYSASYAVTTYSSKRTNNAGSSDEALDLVLKLSGDEENFKPITDDYAYVIEEDIRGEQASENYGYDGVYEQFVYLYSFNKSGKTVQCIYRLYHMEYLSEEFSGSEFPESFKKWTFDEESGAYYIDYLIENGEMMTKEELSMDLQRHGQHKGYYFSKPINN